MEAAKTFPKEYTEFVKNLEGKFVILKPQYWGKEIDGSYINPHGSYSPATLRMPFMDHTFKKDPSGNKIRRLTPRIGYVREIKAFSPENDPYYYADVQTSFYFPRYRHFELIDPSWLTTFKVVLRPDSEPRKYGSQVLGKASEFKIGEIVDTLHDSDNSEFLVREMETGNKSAYNIHDLLFLPDELYKKLEIALPLTVVSKTGYLPPEIPKNIQQIVFSKLSGLDSKYTSQNIIKGVQHWLYGEDQTRKEEQVNTLKFGPLPYGSSEENFVGGKRKKPTRKTNPKLRTTRKSKIFSRYK